MKNRIILNQADFSANNIGKVYEVGDFTKKVLAKQTQYTVEDAEAAALDTFLNQLTADGYIGGDSPLLDTLLIPGLAASHDELLYDIAHLDEYGYPTNVMSDAEATVEASGRTYRPVSSNGKNVALQRYYDRNYMTYNQSVARSMMPNYNFRKNTAGQNFKSFSIIIYSHKPVTYTYNVVGSPNFKIKNTYSSFLNPANEAEIYNKLEYTSLGKFNIIGYNLDNNTLKATIDGVEESVEVNEQAIFTGTASTAYFVFADASSSFHAEASLLAIGTFLDSSQCAALKGYVETFLTAIHATI